MAFFGLFNKKQEEHLDQGLSKTKQSVFDKMARAVAGKSTVDDDVLDNLEEVLITSDVGVDTTLKIIQRIEQRVARDKYINTSELNTILRDEIATMLTENNTPDMADWDLPSDHKPYVILVVGVNGVGKTTTIGKLALRFQEIGRSVMLAAADTFRAAADEQLAVWAERANVQLVKHQPGSDPAAVVFDAVQAAKARGIDLLIVDTAGRMHNKKNLMDELGKMRRIIDREYPEATVRCMLVLDATTGQNGINQAKMFKEAVEINGIILTKLDGTAKGGVAIAIRRELNVPVWYIGVGEGIDDLQAFDAKEFTEALFSK